jgi:tetratricopeptide (TPR) repeat protein
MIRVKIFFALALLPVALVLLNLTAAGKDAWTSARSNNFYLVGNADEKEIRQVAVRLEQFREIFRQLHNQTNFNSPIPTKVVVFRDAASFHPYKPLLDDGKIDAAVTGYFLTGETENYIALSVGEQAQALPTIFHEYTHFLVNNNIGDASVPPWFNEGLAEYYSTLRIENEQTIALGAPPAGYSALLARAKPIPANVFFNTDNYTLNQQTDESAQLFYAQSWALMHYLLNSGDGARRKQVAVFLDSVMNGRPAREAFAEAFLLDFSAAEKELRKYVEAGRFETVKIALKQKLSAYPEIKSAPLGETEAQTHLAELLLNFGRVEEAETHARRALALNPNSSQAHVALARVKTNQGKIEEADKLLEKAVRLDPNNFLAHFHYADNLSRNGMSEFGFVEKYPTALAERMRASLKKAVALNQNFAPAYELYAFIGAARGDNLDESVEYLNRALKLAPGNQRYLIRMAELLMWKHDFPNAVHLAERVARNAPEARLKVYAESTLLKIRNYEGQVELSKNPNAKRKEIPDRIFTEEELRILREKGLIESLNMLVAKPGRGEKRILGYVTKIECRPDAIFYEVKAGEQTIRLRSDSFETVSLVAYSREAGNAKLGCGETRLQSPAVIVYRSAANAAAANNAQWAGEVKSIEFVPANFHFLN